MYDLLEFIQFYANKVIRFILGILFLGIVVAIIEYAKRTEDTIRESHDGLITDESKRRNRRS